GVLVGVFDAHLFVILLQRREVEASDEVERVDRRLQSPFQIGQECLQVAAAWSPIEAAHRHVDGVDGAASQDLQQMVANLLEPQSFLDDVAVLGGQANAALEAKEIRRVEEINVQGVALDPLAAVEQTA